MDFVKEIRVFCAMHDMRPPTLMIASGLSVRTWHGWMRGADPKLSNVNKVRAEMARIKAELGAV